MKSIPPSSPPPPGNQSCPGAVWWIRYSTLTISNRCWTSVCCLWDRRAIISLQYHHRKCHCIFLGTVLWYTVTLKSAAIRTFSQNKMCPRRNNMMWLILVCYFLQSTCLLPLQAHNILSLTNNTFKRTAEWKAHTVVGNSRGHVCVFAFLRRILKRYRMWEVLW